MGDIDDRLRELLDRRRELPGSIAVMETHAEAAAINRHLFELENLTMSWRLLGRRTRPDRCVLPDRLSP